MKPGLILKVLELLREVVNGRVAAYVVGGAVRDNLIGKAVEDIDICVHKSDISLFVRLISSFTGVKPVILGRGTKVLYMFLARDMPRIDVTLMEGDIYSDLINRDFTINAMAFDIRNGELIDPFNGKDDVDRKIVRAVSPRIFGVDPVRIIRMYRFAVALGFDIDDSTRTLARKSVDGLKRVSAERVRDELFRIFSTDVSWDAISLMKEDGVLTELFPVVKYMVGVKQGGYHHLDVWEHSLLSLRMLEDALGDLPSSLGSDVREYLCSEISGGRFFYQLLKLATLFHDVGKPFTRKVFHGDVHFWKHQCVGSDIIRKMAERMRLSNEEQAFLSKVVYWHMFPIYLLKLYKRGEDYTQHLGRFLTKVQRDVIGIFLLSYADLRASRGVLSGRSDPDRLLEIAHYAIDYYFKRVREVSSRPPLLDGCEIMKVLGIPPGPMVGEIKDKLRMMEVSGIIDSKDEALKWLRENYSERGG